MKKFFRMLMLGRFPFNKDRFYFNALYFYFLIFWLLALFYFQGVFEIQILTVFLFAATYFLWGVTTHWLEGSLHLKNVLEYFLTSFIGFLIMAFTLIYGH